MNSVTALQCTHIHSFADPETSLLLAFAGSSCAVEGDPEAKVLLNKLFSCHRGQLLPPAESDTKALYHAATVMACNNLVVTVDHEQADARLKRI